ncbi:MAG: hypothetical protein MRY63_06075 [Neomegalonema sp.]|nr:hypothetical protein [Neomegalonema sp.]
MTDLEVLAASAGGIITIAVIVIAAAAALYIIRSAIELLRYLAYLLDGPAMRGPLNRDGREQLEAIIAAAIISADQQRQTEPLELNTTQQIAPRRPRS